MLTPSASNTSALPELLETDLFPCLATGTPVPATTNAAVVEMLKVWETSPPVPHVSTTRLCSVSIFVAFSRIIRAAPVISSMVSPFSLNEVIKLPI